MPPLDDAGKRVDFDQIPKMVSDLIDDPFRSLVGALRRVGGYAKEEMPFAKFIWADAPGRHIKAQDVAASFSSTLVQALDFAKRHDAKHLPGWCGPSSMAN